MTLMIIIITYNNYETTMKFESIYNITPISTYTHTCTPTYLYAFRPGHSTELAALRLVDHLITQMDNYRVYINIYIDLFRAFDILSHDISLEKLKYDGITVTSVNLVQRCL